MKSITSTMLALAAASLLSQNALATTSWQMQQKHGDTASKRVFEGPKQFKQLDANKFRDVLGGFLRKLLEKRGPQHQDSKEKFSGHNFSGDNWPEHGFWSKEPRENSWGKHSWVKNGWGKHKFRWDKWDREGREWGDWDWKDHKHYQGCGHHDDIPEVPIPAAVWLMFSALGVLGGLARRRG